MQYNFSASRTDTIRGKSTRRGNASPTPILSVRSGPRSMRLRGGFAAKCFWPNPMHKRRTALYHRVVNLEHRSIVPEDSSYYVYYRKISSYWQLEPRITADRPHETVIQNLRGLSTGRRILSCSFVTSPIIIAHYFICPLQILLDFQGEMLNNMMLSLSDDQKSRRSYRKKKHRCN